MIRCEECGKLEPSGALYCSDCGALLLADHAVGQAAPLPFVDALDSPATPVLLGQELNPVSEVSHITVVIPASGRRIRLELSDEIQVGRNDPANDHFPELDLTEDQGSALGVSRVHALIRCSTEGIVLVDEGSANGTSLNGYHLPPQLPYPLHSGDEVRFGQLLVHLFFD
jgi:pSer/pThr/pTyr-binding forkhead associated (FHA) protein